MRQRRAATEAGGATTAKMTQRAKRRAETRTQLDAAVHAEENVVALNVAVDDRARVEKLKRLQALPTAKGVDMPSR